MAEDLVTLGFAFNAGNAESVITGLIRRFEDLKSVSDSVTKVNIGNIFSPDFNSVTESAYYNIGRVSTALAEFSANASNAKKAGESLFSGDFPARTSAVANAMNNIGLSINGLAEKMNSTQTAASSVFSGNYAARISGVAWAMGGIGTAFDGLSGKISAAKEAMQGMLGGDFGTQMKTLADSIRDVSNGYFKLASDLKTIQDVTSRGLTLGDAKFYEKFRAISESMDALKLGAENAKTALRDALPPELTQITNGLKQAVNGLSVEMNNLHKAASAVKGKLAEGLKFNAGDSVQKIIKLHMAISNLDTKATAAQGALDRLFSKDIYDKIDMVYLNLERFNSALVVMASVAKQAQDALPQELVQITNGLKQEVNGLSVEMNNLHKAASAVKGKLAEGLKFNAGESAQKIIKLHMAISNLGTKATAAQGSLDRLFSKDISDKIDMAYLNLERFNGALVVMASVAKQAREALPPELTQITNGLKQAVNGLSVEMNNLHKAASAVKGKLAEGLKFNTGDSVQKIIKLHMAISNLGTKATAAQGALDRLFNKDISDKIDKACSNLERFNRSLAVTASLAKQAQESLKTLPSTFSLFSASHIKPIPASVIKALEQYAKTAEKTAKNLQRIEEANRKIDSRSPRGMGDSLGYANSQAYSLGSSLARLFSSGMVMAYFRQASAEAIKFGVELAHITSLTLDYDPSAMRTKLLNISAEFGNATKLAEGAYYAYSSGVRGGEDGLSTFTASMGKLARLIRADITPTIDAATSLMNAYGLTAKDSAEVTDWFYSIVKQGKAHGSQLASGLGQVISTAATAEVSINELGASVASLTKVMQTRNAITYFNNMLSKMLKPTKEVRLAAEKLGIEFGLESLKAKGFAGMMQEIHDKTKGSQQAILSLFPDLRGQRAALHLLNKGWADFQSQLEFFANKSGVADKAMKKLTYDLNYQISSLPNTLEKNKIAVGDLVVKLLTLGGALTPVVAAFNNMGETGHAVFGVMTLLIGGYSVLKVATAAYNTMKVAEIRNNSILALQRQREIKDRWALIAAYKAQMAASAGSMSSMFVGNMFTGVGFAGGMGYGGFRALLKWKHAFDLPKLAGKASLTMGTLGVAVSLLGKGLGTLTKVILSVFSPTTALITLAVAALGASVDVLGAEGKVNWSSGIAGFFNGKALEQKAMNSRVMSAVGDWIYDFFTGALSAIKKVSKVMKTAQEMKNTLMNLQMWEQDAIESFMPQNKKPINERIRNAQADFNRALSTLSSDSFKQASADYRLAKAAVEQSRKTLDESSTAISAVRKNAENYVNLLHDKNFRTLLKEEFKRNYKAVGTADGFVKANNKNIDDYYLNVWEMYLESAKDPTRLWKDFMRITTAGKGGKTTSEMLGSLDKVVNPFMLMMNWREIPDSFTKDVLVYQEKYFKALEAPLKAAQDEAMKKSPELQKNADDLQKSLQKSIEPIQKYFNVYKRILEEMQKIIDGMTGMVAKQRFSMYSDSRKKFELFKTAYDNQTAYFDLLGTKRRYHSSYGAMRSGGRLKNGVDIDWAAAKQRMENTFNAYNQYNAILEKEIASTSSFMDKIGQSLLDVTLKDPNSTLQNKIATIQYYAGLARQEGEKLSGWNQNTMSPTTRDPKKLIEGYNKMKQAYDLQIRAQQMAIDHQKKLAQAEQNANQNTLRLIQSMDKFNSSAVESVDVYSRKAVELQARSFATPVNFQPVQVAQQGLGAANQAMSNTLFYLRSMMLNFKNQASFIKTNDEQSLQKNKDMMNLMIQDYEDASMDIKDEMERIERQLRLIPAELAKSLGNDEMLRRVTSIDNNVNGISVN